MQFRLKVASNTNMARSTSDPELIIASYMAICWCSLVQAWLLHLWQSFVSSLVSPNNNFTVKRCCLDCACCANTKYISMHSTVQSSFHCFTQLLLLLYFLYTTIVLATRPSHVFQCTREKSGRPGWSGDVIGRGLRGGCVSLPTHPRNEHGHGLPCD